MAALVALQMALTRAFTPASRYGHCAFAVDDESMFVLGGATIQGALSSELLQFHRHNRTWSPKNHGNGPPAIEGHACTVIGRNVLVMGGNTAAGRTNQTWVLQLDKFTWKKGPEMPEAVRRHTAALYEDEKTTKLVVYGGSLGPSCQENLTDAVTTISVSVDGFSGEWKTQRTIGSSPGPRMGHVAVQDPRAPFLYVIGGQTDNYCKQSGFQNDVHALNTKSWQWTRVSPGGTALTKRYGHTAWYNSGSVQITGGTCGSACGACGHANDTFRLVISQPDFGHFEWVQTKQSGRGPPPRDRHTTVLCGSMLALDYGGFIASKDYSSDVYSFDFGGNKSTWEDLT